MKNILIIVIGLVILLVGGAWFYSQQGEQVLVDEPELSEEQKFNNSGRAKAIEDEKDLWMIYEDENANLSIKYPHNVDFGQSVDDLYTLTVKSDKVTGLEGTMGYNEETSLENIVSLEKGEYGQEVDFPLAVSKKVKELDNVNAQEFMVLGRFEVCSVIFQRKLYFFNNGYQVVITLSGSRDSLIESSSDYFEINPDNCGDMEVWNFDKQAQFYQDLSQDQGSEVVQEWFDLFDEIISTIEFNNQPILGLIQGSWISVDDENSVIEFKDKIKIDYYDGEKMTQGLFELDNNQYLTVTIDNETFEYKIVELTDDTLVLTYLPRGNTLEYRR